jgi:excisionase family DNA binding protein
MRSAEWEGETLSVRDAARALDVHENTIRNWIQKGILKAETLPGSRYRRPTSESVRAILAERVPSYHDLHVTTAEIPRTSIFSLPYGVEVSCNRVGGWSLWDTSAGLANARQIAGEYGDGLRLDVGGFVIVDSLSHIAVEIAKE